MATASEGQSPASAQDGETTAGEEGGHEEQRADSSEEERSDSAQNAADSEGQDTADSESQDTDDSEGEEEGVASGRSIAAAIEDVSSLPGETVSDQDGRKIGEVKEIYAVGEDQTPMWVTIESATGLGRHRMVFVPLARIKNQNDEIRVPYSFDHIHDSPEVEAGDEVSEEDDRALRVYYSIGLADQELVQAARSYASQVPEEEGAATKIEGDAAEGPVRELDDTPPAKRVAEAYEKQKEEEGEEHRKGKDTTADEIFQEEGSGDDEKPSGDEEPKGEEKQSASQDEKDGEDKNDGEDKKDGED
jgi:hypothetical protein